jgi:DNA (cytosine-5)-methyltransferase 1
VNYYNEIDPFAAGWLRNLMIDGLIPFGDVDTRSIEDVSPDDLRPYTQCHFFAGIGVWSYALRLAGWPDDRPVWTGSCPCQPFSAAGKGGGFADERHLWPAQFHLIRERRPIVWLGEQVASKDGLAWFDLVQADLEGEGYAVGAVDTCSAGFGAPHIRQRLRIAAQRVANAAPEQHDGAGGRGARGRAEHTERSAAIGLADADGRYAGTERQQRGGEQRQQPQDGGTGLVEHATSDGRIERRAEPGGRGLASGCGFGRVGDDDDEGLEGQRCGHRPEGRRLGTAGPTTEAGQPCGVGHGERPGPVNGFWRAADWLYCRDGKWRPVEPGTFPLAHGAPARVGRLRGYGNAVDAIATKAFVQAVMECRP